MRVKYWVCKEREEYYGDNLSQKFQETWKALF